MWGGRRTRCASNMFWRDRCSCVLQGVVLGQKPTLRQRPVLAGQPDSSEVSAAWSRCVTLGVSFCGRCVRCVRQLYVAIVAHCYVAAAVWTVMRARRTGVRVFVLCTRRGLFGLWLCDGVGGARPADVCCSVRCVSHLHPRLLLCLASYVSWWYNLLCCRGYQRFSADQDRVVRQI
jgi:hypothetical protein